MKGGMLGEGKVIKPLGIFQSWKPDGHVHEDERENCRRGREKQVIRAEIVWGSGELSKLLPLTLQTHRAAGVARYLPSGGGGGES